MVHEVLVNGRPHMVRVLNRNGNLFKVEVDKKTVMILLKNAGKGNVAIMEVDGNTFHAKIECKHRNRLEIKIGRKLFNVEFPSKILRRETHTRIESVAAISKKPATHPIHDANVVIAPIAGKLVLWKAKIGQKIEKDECVCVLEAMKMANEITAPKSGILKEIRVCEGAVVNKGDVLAVID